MMRGAIVGIVAVGLCSTSAWAETFFVAPAGDDGAAGTEAAPWRTLQRAADRVEPGDTVEVAAGAYAGMYLDTAGTEAAPITFTAAAGAVVTGDNPTTGDGINLEGVAWVTIEGFEVTGATRAGIRAVECHHVTLRGNRADRNGRWGILTGYCDDLLIEGNETSRSAVEHGIYVSNSGDRPVIRGNLVWGNRANGVHMNGDAEVGGGDGVISEAVVEGNVILDNGEAGGSAINCDGVVDSVIANNLIHDNRSAGIALYRIDGGAPSTGNLVVNNTIVMPDGARWAVLIKDGSTGNTLRNNIILHLGPVRGAVEACATCLVGLVSDHNALTPRFSIGEEIVTLEAWRAATGQESDSWAADLDLFVDAATGDYQLRDGAPAVDAGRSDEAPARDLAGHARPQGAGIDLGAFEHCGEDGCEMATCAGAACVEVPGMADDPEPGDGPTALGCQIGGGGGSAALVAGLLVPWVGARRRRRSRG